MVPKRYAIDGNGKKDDDGGRGRVGEETESWVRYRYFMHYTEGSIMGLLVIWLLLSSAYFLSDLSILFSLPFPSHSPFTRIPSQPAHRANTHPLPPRQTSNPAPPSSSAPSSS